MQLLLHPTYFPNIQTMAVLAQGDVVWEVHDNYQKQTFRNRCHICTDQGLQLLSIPIQHVGGTQGRQAYAKVHLDNSYPWQRQHWRTLQTAYRTSPFFEFFEDEIAPLYHRPFNFLLDFTLQTIETLCNCLALDMPKAKNNGYEKAPKTFEDLRFLVNAKKPVEGSFPLYTQVFGDRHGFIPNASTLDLLFNEGSLALDYLKQLNLDLLDA